MKIRCCVLAAAPPSILSVLLALKDTWRHALIADADAHADADADAHAWKHSLFVYRSALQCCFRYRQRCAEVTCTNSPVPLFTGLPMQSVRESLPSCVVHTPPCMVVHHAIKLSVVSYVHLTETVPVCKSDPNNVQGKVIGLNTMYSVGVTSVTRPIPLKNCVPMEVFIITPRVHSISSL